MNRTRSFRTVAVLLAAVLTLFVSACGDDDEPTATDSTEAPAGDSPMTEDTADDSMTEDTTDDSMTADSSTICDADAIVEAVEGGGDEGTLDGMTDDPVGTAASNNPVLTTLTTAVTAAGLVDTLNSAEALTVFAPTDCAFAALDPDTLQAALDDPTGLLTQVLGFHVVAGERLSSEDLAGMTEVTTFTEESLSIAPDGDTVMIGGQATVVVPDIQTANATVHLIDTVMIPPAG